MTKKDFIKLADVLKTNRPGVLWSDDRERGKVEMWALLRHQIAAFCMGNNPKFNLQRWLDYIDGKCGPNGGKVE